MALYKEVLSKQGVKLSYWRIGKRIMDSTTKEVHFEILPYVNEETRRNGCNYLESAKIRIDMFDNSPIVTKDIDVDGTEKEVVTYSHVYDDYFSPQVLTQTGQNEVEAMYNYIKLNVKELADAQDC